MIRNAVTAILFSMLIPALTWAQSRSESRGWGYGFAGGGATSHGAGLAHLGIGGEGLLIKGLGAGGEIGYLRGSNSGAGLISINSSYHFTKAVSDRRLAPFVTGGYSLLFPSDSLSLVNFGGGVNYWMDERIGVRLEFRDHVFVSGSTHIAVFRAGITFR